MGRSRLLPAQGFKVCAGASAVATRPQVFASCGYDEAKILWSRQDNWPDGGDGVTGTRSMEREQARFN
jgi:hypothetical protein